MLGKEIPELMKMLVKEKREEGLELKGMSNRELPKDSYVSFKDDDGYVSFMFIFMFAFMFVTFAHLCFMNHKLWIIVYDINSFISLEPVSMFRIFVRETLINKLIWFILGSKSIRSRCRTRSHGRSRRRRMGRHKR